MIHLIAVVNHSGLVTDDEVRAMVRGVRTQLDHNFAPAYRIHAPDVRFFSDVVNAPNDSAIITVRDESQVADALGDHDQDDAGRPRGEVMVKPVLDQGGRALDTDISVSSVLSHEVLELVADPYIVDWSQGWDGVLYAREVCDPVESDSYMIETGVRGEYVSVSSFVTPEWFTTDPPPHALYDFLGKLERPFDMTSGGYVITMKGGEPTAEYGDDYPAWRKVMKNRRLSRTKRRRRCP